MISFANTLKTLRKERNLTQSDVAERIGIDRSTYAYYERGATKPDFECILKLCKIYNIDIANLTNMFLNDENTNIVFKTPEKDDDDDEIFHFNDLDSLNIDEYEKMILLFYRQTPYKKLFFVKIKQAFDEISNANK